MRLTAILALILAGPASADESKPKFEPSSIYVAREVEGWTVRVHPDLIGKDKALGDRAIRELEVQLYQVGRQVPPKAVEKLRKVTIWLEKSEPHHPCASYHPSREWLTEHGMNPDKARCVEIANASTFLDWSRIQPWMLFHELSHAYHDQLLDRGFDNPDITTSYQTAKADGRYDAVLHAGRDGTERAYAMNNPMEYFAEGSEAFFGLNDFYPFNRVELLKHDPRLHAAMVEAWGVESSKKPRPKASDIPER